MANMLHKFKDRDVQRVIKAARSAGLDPAAVEVDPHTGRIKVHSGSSRWTAPTRGTRRWPTSVRNQPSDASPRGREIGECEDEIIDAEAHGDNT
jgi:hypothetical protein